MFKSNRNFLKYKNLTKCYTTNEKKSKLNHQREWIQPIGYDTEIKIYNCITLEKVPLILQNNHKWASWYSCGPTVYDSAHIGHASCFVKLDILQRILKNYFDINLISAMNITDIDDKIIKKSQEKNLDWRILVKQYELEFWNEMEMLDVQEPDFVIRVTENIEDIIQFIDKLIKSDKAYHALDKSIYFEVEKFKNYGKLQRLNLEDIKHNKVKKTPFDFALWKTISDGSKPTFKSPWGEGRPGWHIECSTMASSIFGNHIDFHCGGLDLKFPHHENEEAQSCTYHNSSQWVNYWIHTGHLKFENDSEKMSKSLNNTIGITEMLEMFSPEVFRVFNLLSNYRSNIEFGLESMKNSENVLKKFLSFFDDSRAYTDGLKPKVNFDSNKIFEKISKIEKKIDSALKDDFDTAKSVQHLIELITFTSKIINNTQSDPPGDSILELNPSSIQAVSNFVYRYISNYFGLNFEKDSQKDNQRFDNIENLANIEKMLEGIVKVRAKIRDSAVKSNNEALFEISDNIRDCLKEGGVEVKDHGKTSSWHYLK